MTAAATPVIAVDGLRIEKRSQEARFVLSVPRITIARGEMVALIGPSGCGKSTLLDVLALAAPVAALSRFVFAPRGDAAFDLTAAFKAGDVEGMSGLRREFIGYVTQTGGLLPFLTVERNLAGLQPWRAARSGVRELAEALGIQRHLRKKPRELSAGERQRVAIGRAIAHRPALILADEPTAALDPITSQRVMDLLIRQVGRLGASCVIATHDWDRVASLGLRKLDQHFTTGPRSEAVCSVIQDPVARPA